MTTDRLTQQPVSLTVKQSLHRALTHHQAGRLEDAERIYKDILQIQPNHPEANYNLGVLAAQSGKLVAGLPYFKAALDADRNQGQFWISYIAALIDTGQTDAAGRMLDQGRQQGLSGDVFEALAARLSGGTHSGGQSTAANQHKSQPASSVVPHNDKKKSKTKPIKADRKSASQKVPGPQEINSVLTLFSAGRYAEVTNMAKMLTERFPQHGFGWAILGAVLGQMGRSADSLLPLQKAAALLPGNPDVHNNLGITLQNLGRLDEAEASCRRALQIKPNFAEAHNTLGAILKELGRPDEAEASCRRALQIKPNFAEAHNTLGAILQELGRPDEAEASCRRALQIKQDYAEAYNNLGNIFDEAGRLSEAEASYRQALQINPYDAEVHFNLGITLKKLNRPEEAEVSYRTALQIKPDYAEAYYNLGNALKDMGRVAEAEASYRQALQIKPCDSDVYYNLATVLMEVGQFADAEANFMQALQIKPNYLDVLDCLLFMHNYDSSKTTSHYLEQARQYGQIVSKKATPKYYDWLCPNRPGRLRVGLVSGDFSNHPVGYFLESILTQIDPKSVELIAYPTYHKTDDLTARIKPHFAAWNPLFGQTDEAAARLIHNDGVHVLIDLSGHTAHNRLPVFSWKPAPVQVAWQGYLASTGVPEMDYILGDPHVTPVNEANHFTEAPWQLPECYMCFTEPDVDLEVMPLPALSTGSITFGCFNNLTKMSDAAVALWARVLTAIPSSKLFLKTKLLNGISVRETTLKRFVYHGIAAERLILEGAGYLSRAEYLAAFHRVDIALDPFPYAGCTTSMEGLWMGVPMLTKKGDRFISHVGETIAHNAGLSDWIAVDEDDFVAKAMTHSSDLVQLAKLRAGLRHQVLTSPLFDAARFARHFEVALREMWNRWLEQGRR